MFGTTRVCKTTLNTLHIRPNCSPPTFKCSQFAFYVIFEVTLTLNFSSFASLSLLNSVSRCLFHGLLWYALTGIQSSFWLLSCIATKLIFQNRNLSPGGCDSVDWSVLPYTERSQVCFLLRHMHRWSGWIPRWGACPGS